MKIIYTMKKCNEKSEGFHSIFSVMNTFTVLQYEMYHTLQSLSLHYSYSSTRYTMYICDLLNIHLMISWISLKTITYYLDINIYPTHCTDIFFLVMQSSRILEGFLRSSFKSSAFLFSLSLSNMALA